MAVFGFQLLTNFDQAGFRLLQTIGAELSLDKIVKVSCQFADFVVDYLDVVVHLIHTGIDDSQTVVDCREIIFDCP